MQREQLHLAGAVEQDVAPLCSIPAYMLREESGEQCFFPMISFQECRCLSKQNAVVCGSAQLTVWVEREAGPSSS